MKKPLLLTGLAALMLSLPGLAAVGGTATPASPLSALSAYWGQWTGQGKILDSPFGKAGDAGGETNCNWSPNHGFLVCDQKTHSPAGASNDLSIYTYNQKDHAYHFFGLSRNSGNVRSPKLTIEGNRWTYLSEFTGSGKHVRIRTINVFTSPTTVTYKTEYSVDGAPWKLMGSGSSHRVK